jgi:hypothetical protein
MAPDSDFEKILELLFRKNLVKFADIYRFIGVIGKNTLYKKLKILIQEEIIQKSPENIEEGKAYLLGNTKEDAYLETDRFILGNKRQRLWIERKKFFLKKAINKNLISAGKFKEILSS